MSKVCQKIFIPIQLLTSYLSLRRNDELTHDVLSSQTDITICCILTMHARMWLQFCATSWSEILRRNAIFHRARMPTVPARKYSKRGEQQYA